MRTRTHAHIYAYAHAYMRMRMRTRTHAHPNVVVSKTHGGSKACDERLMESAGYFDPDRCCWKYKLCRKCDPTKDKICRHKLRHGVMYDGGVDMATLGR